MYIIFGIQAVEPNECVPQMRTENIKLCLHTECLLIFVTTVSRARRRLQFKIVIVALLSFNSILG